MTTDLLTPEDLYPMLQAICDAEPDRVNPMKRHEGGLACLYRTDEDPDDNCVIGRLANVSGWELPSGNPDAYGAARDLGWPVDANGALYLNCVQRQADGCVNGSNQAQDGSHYAPRPWGKLVLDIPRYSDDFLWVQPEIVA